MMKVKFFDDNKNVLFVEKNRSHWKKCATVVKIFYFPYIKNPLLSMLKKRRARQQKLF